VVVGEVSTFTEVLVVGGGPGGYTAAQHAASLGRSVVLVERDRLGGVCLNSGCIPSKALIQVAHTAALPATAARWGVELVARVDMNRVQDWMASVIDGLRAGVDVLMRQAGVTVLAGTARFTSPHRVVVATPTATQHIEFDHAIVATGSRPMELASLPVDHHRVLDSTDALGLREVPPLLAVVGGGYIGLELGCAFQRLGSAVTVVEVADRLLPTMHAGLGRALERRLTAQGLRVLLRTGAIEDDGTALLVNGPSGECRVEADAVIVAVGRRPNTDDLGLERAGVACGAAGRIGVDRARRAAGTVLAIGDVTDGPGLAHKASAEAEVAGAVAAGRRAEFDPACIPQVVFTDPQVASVGLTPAEAEEAGVAVETRRLPLAASVRAVMSGETAGMIELVAERGSGALLGAHLLGPEAAELIAETALAIEMGATVDDIALTIHPHPTLSEAIAQAARAGGHPTAM
jgi:dihydrolipoamide dehydrogenase